MNLLKQIIGYAIWIMVSLLLGFCHMYIVLGPRGEPSTGLLHLIDVFYTFGLFHVGIRIGLIIALLFVLLDVFYLKKKLENNIKSTGIRFMILLVITGIVATIHYILEKVIDII
jgi:hypothetical protein